MAKIAIILGHPDPAESRLCRALAKAYQEGASSNKHDAILIDVATLDFPFLRSQEDWSAGRENTPPALFGPQAAIEAADHIVIMYPLWLGTMPAMLKAFLEQTLRPGVALKYHQGMPKGLFQGKSARVVVTMGMPAFFYRWWFWAHSLRNLERNILGLVGVSPIRRTLYGAIEQQGYAEISTWLDEMRDLGRQAL